jgi:hypothetical protein
LHAKLILRHAVLLCSVAACQPPTSQTDGLGAPDNPGTPLAPVTGPVPEPVFPNAPSGAGWTLVTACRSETLPGLQPERNECGQTHWSGQIPTLSIERATNDAGFMRVGFPSAQNSSREYGGSSPSSFTLAGTFPANTGHLYVGQYMRWSPNWWHPANEGHKTMYLMEKDATTAHFFAWVDNTSVEAGALLHKFGTQWVNNQGSPYADEVWVDQEPSHRMPKGTWHLVEYLLTPNSSGNRDGRLQVWVDGVRVMDAQNVPLFRPGATQQWSGIWYSPIFASPGRMPPTDQFFDLSHLRILVR